MHEAWWKAYGAGRSLYVILIDSGDDLIGIAPLMVTQAKRLGWNFRFAEFIGTRSFDYADIIVETGRTDVVRELLSAAADRVPFDCFSLRNVPAASPTLAALQALSTERGLSVDARVLFAAPTRLFNDPRADSELPNKKSLKRHHNYFQKRGRLEFRNCSGATEILPFLSVFFEQHVRRRAHTETPSDFLDARARVFFTELVRALPPEWLLFSVVLLDEQPIAMHLGFEYGGAILWYKPSFDVEHAKHSPGEVLLRFLLQYALARGVRELDFTIGDEGFKHRFANHTRHTYAARVYRSRTHYRLGRLALDVREWIERHPATARFARRALARWRAQPGM